MINWGSIGGLQTWMRGDGEPAIRFLDLKFRRIGLHVQSVVIESVDHHDEMGCEILREVGGIWQTRLRRKT